MENGTIGKANIAFIESFDLPTVSVFTLTFLLSSEMEKLFSGPKPTTENPTTEYYSGDYSGDSVFDSISTGK